MSTVDENPWTSLAVAASRRVHPLDVADAERWAERYGSRVWIHSEAWDCLADPMDVLAQLRVEWVFPGHGIWSQVGFDDADTIAALVERTGRPC